MNSPGIRPAGFRAYGWYTELDLRPAVQAGGERFGVGV